MPSSIVRTRRRQSPEWFRGSTEQSAAVAWGQKTMSCGAAFTARAKRFVTCAGREEMSTRLLFGGGVSTRRAPRRRGFDSEQGARTLTMSAKSSRSMCRSGCASQWRRQRSATSNAGRQTLLQQGRARLSRARKSEAGARSAFSCGPLLSLK